MFLIYPNSFGLVLERSDLLKSEGMDDHQPLPDFSCREILSIDEDTAAYYKEDDKCGREIFSRDLNHNDFQNVPETVLSETREKNRPRRKRKMVPVETKDESAMDILEALSNGAIVESSQESLSQSESLTGLAGLIHEPTQSQAGQIVGNIKLSFELELIEGSYSISNVHVASTSENESSLRDDKDCLVPESVKLEGETSGSLGLDGRFGSYEESDSFKVSAEASSSEILTAALSHNTTRDSVNNVLQGIGNIDTDDSLTGASASNVKQDKQDQSWTGRRYLMESPQYSQLSAYPQSNRNAERIPNLRALLYKHLDDENFDDASSDIDDESDDDFSDFDDGIYVGNEGLQFFVSSLLESDDDESHIVPMWGREG